MRKNITSVAHFLWKFVQKQWEIFFIQSLLCLVWSTKEALFPYFIKNMVNAITNRQERNVILHSLLWQSMGLLLIWITMELALPMRLQGILAIHSFPKFRANIRNYIFMDIMYHSYHFFKTLATGNLSNKISDLPRASESLLQIILLHLTSIGGAVLISVTLLWSVEPRFAGLFLIWLLIHLLLQFHFAKKCNAATTKHANAIASLNGIITDVLVNILNVFLFSKEQYESQYLEKNQEKEINKFKFALWKVEKVKILQSIYAISYIAGMLYVLTWSWLNNHIQAGDFALIPMLSFNLLGMVWWFSYQINILFREIGIIKAALCIIENDPQKIDNKRLKIEQGSVAFNHVSFGYDEKRVFDNLSMFIPPRQKVALVGLSGAGKSTWIRLLLRLYEVTGGYIAIDDQDIAIVNKGSIREQIGVIPQDLTLFNRSIFENIQYARMDATRQEVYKAALLAGCEDFIHRLPHGYHTKVGEQGVKLSGGERQRIAIARAFLKDSPILVMDEATSSLDLLTEATIQNNLKHFITDKTVIVIAHRLATIKQMDRIIIFENGKIISDNDKYTTLRDNAYFKKLYKIQSEPNLIAY